MAKTTTHFTEPIAPVTAPVARSMTVKTVPADDTDALRKKYDELAKQSALAAKGLNFAEVERIKPLKLKAFTAWRDSLKPGELAAKDQARRRFRMV